jgi:hypothetical protein
VEQKFTTKGTLPNIGPNRDSDAGLIGCAPAPRGVLRFFICSRDRPAILRRCIEGLGQVLREASLDGQAICYIVDDSTRPEFSAYEHSIVGSADSNGLQIEVVDRTWQDAIYERLAGLGSGPMTLLKSATRKLGHGAWDLAGVRNFAFLLAYCYSNEDDLVVFLDDDILLTSAVYRGRFVEVDGAPLIRELMSSTPRGDLVASGTAYFGQVDGSVMDHLRLVSEDALRLLSRDSDGCDARDEAALLLDQLRLFPSTLPVQLAFAGARDSIEGPGVSGALLATTPASMYSHFLPLCYNEDWIWLALLGRPDAAINKASHRVLHASPPQQEIVSGVLDYQNIGEIVYRAVRTAIDDAPPGRTALEQCEETISADHFLSAKESLMREMRSLLDVRARIERSASEWPNEGDLRLSARSALAGIERYIEDAIVRTEAADHAALHLWFRHYLADIPAWRNLLDWARTRLCEDIETHGSSRR